MTSWPVTVTSFQGYLIGNQFVCDVTQKLSGLQTFTKDTVQDSALRPHKLGKIWREVCSHSVESRKAGSRTVSTVITT